jgi:hypothetical protein
MTRTTVTVSAPGAVQDLILRGPKPKPGPVTVVFDAAQAQYVELSNGTRLFIPAGAMPAEGRVILHITPLAAAPHHYNGDTVGLSYVFEAYTEDGQPITESFAQDVLITFGYDPVELAANGINENQLRPAYFSTTSNSWTVPESYVVDKLRHQITMQIDHFTQFGVTSMAFDAVPVDPLESLRYGDPGAVAAHSLRVTNTLTNADTFTITLSGNKWETDATLNGQGTVLLPVPANSGINVQVVVTIPLAAARGATDTVNVRFTSHNVPANWGEAVLTTQVKFYQIYLPTILKTI